MKQGLWLAVGLCLAQNVFAAEGPSYNFIDGAYHHYTSSKSNSSSNGWGLKGSFDVGSQLFIQAGYEAFESDVDTVFGGLGYRFPISPNADIYLRGDVIHMSVFNVSDTSWQAALGLRAMVAPNVELAGEVAHDKLFDTGSTNYMVEGRYGFTPEFSAGLGYASQSDSNVNKWIFSGRFSF